MLPEDVVPWTVAPYSFLVLYSGYRWYHSQTSAGWHLSSQVMLHICVFITSAARLSSMSTILIINHVTHKHVSDLVGFVLDSYPSLMFFTTYTLLLFFWADAFGKSRVNGGCRSQYRIIFIALNLTAYVVQIGLYILAARMSVTPLDHQRFEGPFLSFIFLLTAIGFCVYGFRIYKMLGLAQNKLYEEAMKKIGYVTLICVVCFTIRAGVSLQFAYAPAASVQVPEVIAYLILTEILPSVAILYLTRSCPEPNISDEVLSSTTLQTLTDGPGPTKKFSSLETTATANPKNSKDVTLMLKTPLVVPEHFCTSGHT